MEGRNMFKSDRNSFLAALLAAGLFALSVAGCSSAPPAGGGETGDGKIMIEFSLEPGTVLEYKSNNTREMNFYGMDYNFLHTDHLTMTVREKSEEGNHFIRIKFVESNDQVIKGDEMRDFDSPIKAEGKVLEAEVTPAGEIVDVKGVIAGLPGDQLKGHLEQWFFELPEEAHAVGESWVKDISDSSATSVSKGTATIKLESLGSDKGIAVAVISAKSRSDISRSSERGTITGVQESSIEAKIAVEGGYIVFYKGDSEFRGETETADGEKQNITNFMNFKVELVK
jgi:hypothetical protein